MLLVSLQQSVLLDAKSVSALHAHEVLLKCFEAPICCLSNVRWVSAYPQAHFCSTNQIPECDK